MYKDFILLNEKMTKTSSLDSRVRPRDNGPWHMDMSLISGRGFIHPFTPPVGGLYTQLPYNMIMVRGSMIKVTRNNNR